MYAVGEHEKQPSTAAHLAALLRRVGTDRDRDAFAALFEYFAPRLKAFYRRRGLDAGSADDLVQDAMLRVWHGAAQYDPSRAAPSTWVYVIARNLRTDALRRGQPALPDVDLAEPIVHDQTPEAAAIFAQRSVRLAQALHALPEAQREAVRAAYFDDLTHEQVHQVLGVAIGTVKSRLRLALTRLRAALEETP